MNFNTACQFCNDKRRFQVKLQDARRILTVLRKYEFTIPNDFKVSNNELNEARSTPYHSYPHFMCGHCYHVNTHELRQIEDDIFETAFKLKKYIEENKNNKIKLEVQRVLAGFYPVLCHWFI